MRRLVTASASFLCSLALLLPAPSVFAVSYVTSGTATYCHAGSGLTNTWDSVTAGAQIPSSTGVSFVLASATSCSDIPSYSSTIYTVQNNSTAPITISNPASKALFIKVTFTGDGSNTPVLQSLSLTDTPSGDTSTPNSSMVPPASGTLSGASVKLSATATDSGSGVAKVNFYYTSGTCSVGGTLIGSATTPVGSSYAVTWNTTKVANGSYQACSIATDKSGNVQQVPSSVSVSTSNTYTKPTVFISSPSSGAVLSKSSGTTVRARTIKFGGTISKVTFRHGSTIIAADTTGVNDPNGGKDWSVSWNTLNMPSGKYNLTATAVSGTSKVVSVNLAVNIQ